MNNFYKFVRRLLVAASAAGILAAPGLVHATDLTFFRTVFDTDFASAGVGGMRGGPGTGTIALAGVSGTVTEAYLYWHGPSNSSTPSTANANVTFNGTGVTGTYLGISDDNCWSFANSVAYRANVSSLVTGSGNYSLAGFTDLNNGIDINGVSLVVFFDDGNNSNNRDVVMFNGNDSNQPFPSEANGWNITLNGIDYLVGTASAQFHVADGQTFPDAALIANGTTLDGPGAVFDGDTVPTEGFGPTNGYLWDIRDFSVTSLLNPGLNNLNITTGTNSDCLACVLIAIDLPAGAAPPTNGVPEPGSLALLGLGLSALCGLRRRKRLA